MICEALIREALSPASIGPVSVKANVRKKPSNPKRDAVLEDLRALRAALSVPTEGQTGGCSGAAS